MSELARRRAPRRHSAAGKVVHGDDLLYEFFQNVLHDDDPAFAAVPQLLLETMGVWWPMSVYGQLPVLLPFAVRDPDCRAKPSIGRPDEWSSPNAQGYLRDDNSLVKALPRSLSIKAPRTRKISGRRLGTEFVAAHIWRKVNGTDTLASRIPALNSFVPNLVWLPGQIAKLTDREGSAVQQTAQAMSWSIYRRADVAPSLRDIAERCWQLLPEPQRRIDDVDLTNLNWFQPTDGFISTRIARITSVIEALRAAAAGRPPETKIVATRYTHGLRDLPPEVALGLASELASYLPRG